MTTTNAIMPTELAIQEIDDRFKDVALMPVMNLERAKTRLAELQTFCAHYLQESHDGGEDGGDYGVIPGATSKKKVLYKSGADKLSDVYGLADRYVILSKIEDFDRGLFDYTIECQLTRKTDEMFVGSGLGLCSSYESKFRWRDRPRVCPQCQQETIIKGKEQFGGGWICWKKKGGCGAKFLDTDQVIINQPSGRIENPDLADVKNTALKIAKKRAKVDAVLGVTRSSGLFTQDLEDVVTDTPSKVVATEPITVQNLPDMPSAVANQRTGEVVTLSPDAASWPDDVHLIVDVTVVKGAVPTRSGKPRQWTRYDVLTHRSLTCCTFDTRIGDAAQDAKDRGQPVQLTTEQKNVKYPPVIVEMSGYLLTIEDDSPF